MKKKLVVLLSVLLVATNCMYVSAAPLSVLGDSNTVIVEDETSEDLSEEEVSEEEASEEEISEEEKSEELSEEEKSEEEESEEASEEENSEETDSEEMSEIDDFDGEDIKNIDNLDNEIIELGDIYKDFEYTKHTPWGEDAYIEITKYNGYDSVINIPSQIDGIKVAKIGASAFSGKSTIEKVVIPSTVTYIGEKAFYNCSSLTTVTLNEGLKTIYSGAFKNCVSLKSVVIPSTVSSAYGSYYASGGAFEACSGLTSATIKGSVVGDRMFFGCTSLTSIKIPTTVENIGEAAFYKCVALKSATIESAGTIGSEAFYECLYLENVTIKCAKEIGYRAFYKTGIKSIVVPSTVTSIGEQAFYDCESLSAITFNNGLSSIADEAFANCISLKKVVIPSTVTTLGSNSWYADEGPFENCVSLASVTINGTHIGARAFRGCTSLSEISIPRSVNYIGVNAFQNCSGLKKATIKSSGVIEEYAFEGCGALKNVTLQDGLFSTIESYAFANTAIEKVVLPKTVTTIGDDAFANCTGLKTASLNTGLLTLSSGAFKGCTSLTSVNLPVTLTSVNTSQYSEGSFEGCTSLSDVTINSTIIGARMFRGCKALKMIVIPANMSKIYDQAFLNCSSLSVAAFMGNAPATFGSDVFKSAASSFVIEYFDGKTGWTTPKWNGYPTKKVTKLSGDVCAIFDDVKPGDWYVSAVQYVYDKGIMTGNTQTVFGSSSSIKREAVVQVLYANEKKPAVSGSSGFKDVVAGAWYEKAVIWAKNKGIASGKPDGTFGVGNEITRESLAIMLYKYAQLKKIKTGKTTGASNGYSDSAKISTYAKDAMDWAVTQGVLDGKGSGDKSQKRLDPAGKATRAEFAAMITKLLK